MSWMSTTLSLGAVVGLLALAGCKHSPYGNGVATPVAVAKQACEISGLAEERDVLIKDIDADNPAAGGVQSEHRWTIMKDKLMQYRAEVEASYRFVTQNCNAYNLCMENNQYRESSCGESREAWVTSQAKFNELAIALDKKPWRHHKKGHGHGSSYGYDDRCKKTDCTFGGYRGDCCYDGD